MAALGGHPPRGRSRSWLELVVASRLVGTMIPAQAAVFDQPGQNIQGSTCGLTPGDGEIATHWS